LKGETRLWNTQKIIVVDIERLEYSYFYVSKKRIPDFFGVETHGGVRLRAEKYERCATFTF